jgi:hypothetical protein
MGFEFEIEWISSVVGVIINLKWSWRHIENLDRLNFVIKHWPNDAYDGCDGPSKPKAMTEFFTSKASLFEKHKKMLKQHELFEITSNNDFMWFQLRFLFSPISYVQCLFLIFWFQNLCEWFEMCYFLGVGKLVEVMLLWWSWRLTWHNNPYLTNFPLMNWVKPKLTLCS